MIDPVVVLLAFFAMALIIPSRTYAILAGFALINLVADQFTRADDISLMVVYSAIDYAAAYAVLKYGDIDKLKQSIILSCMITLHLLLELDQVSGASIVFDWYVYGISALILAQILGAKSGVDSVDTTIHRPDFNIADAVKNAVWHRETRRLFVEN